VIVPAVFTLFDDVEQWTAPRASAWLAGPVPPTATAIERDTPALTKDRGKLVGPKRGPEPAH
jgi:hypothetical protein